MARRKSHAHRASDVGAARGKHEPGTATARGRREMRRSAGLPPDADDPPLVPRLAQHEPLALPGAGGGGPDPPSLGITPQTALAEPAVDLLVHGTQAPVLTVPRVRLVGDVELRPEAPRLQLSRLVAQRPLVVEHRRRDLLYLQHSLVRTSPQRADDDGTEPLGGEIVRAVREARERALIRDRSRVARRKELRVDREAPPGELAEERHLVAREQEVAECRAHSNRSSCRWKKSRGARLRASAGAARR